MAPSVARANGVAAALAVAGYDNFYRYQLGLPVWRALATPCEPIFEGFAYIFNRDHTAVFVDARTPQDFLADTVTCAVKHPARRSDCANDDGRLPLWTKARAWSSLPMILSLQRRLPPKSLRKPIGAAAISAAPSRTWTTVTSASTARAAAPTAYLLPKLMMNRPASGGALQGGPRPMARNNRSCDKIEADEITASATTSAAASLTSPAPNDWAQSSESRHFQSGLGNLHNWAMLF